MKLHQIIQHRLSSIFSIYDKNYQKTDNAKIIFEYVNIKNFLLNNFSDNQIVALYLTNDYHYLLTVLACQEIGLCYIPMKSTWPNNRVEQIKSLTHFERLISDELINEIKSIASNTTKMHYNFCSESPLYIMFTSGTTGEPKGVVIQRKSYVNFLNWIDAFFPSITSEDKLINSTGYTFDVSLMEIGLFLIKNVSFYCSNLENNALVLGKELSDLKITISVTVPNNFNLLLSERIFPEINLGHLKYVMLAGSKISPALFTKFKSLIPATHLFNCYGPTEATIYCVAKELTNLDKDIYKNTVSIGKALMGCTAIAINENMKETAPYEYGELIIGGCQLMKEYFNRPEATTKAMIKLNDNNYYKTGDVVFKDSDGNFFVSGRVDDTIKVSGQRVNLSDIDGYIANLTYVEEVATISIEDETKDAVILSFIILSDKNILEKQIKEDLKKILLPFQVPTKVFIKEQLPLNSSGKISKKILKEQYLETINS